MMNDMLSRVVYWKLAIWKGLTGPLMVVIVGLPTTVLNWAHMNPPEKVIAVIGMLVSWYKSFDLYIDQTMARLAKGLPPVQLPGLNGHDDHKVEPESTPSKS